MKKLAYTSLAALLGRPFDPNDKQPTWKMDGDKIAMNDGRPVYIDANGGENPFDLTTLARLNSEAAGHRRTAKEAAEKLKLYDGIDAEAARAALQRVADMQGKEMIDKGEVDKLRSTINAEWEKKYGTATAEAESLKGQIANLMLENAFGNSAFIREKIAVPLGMMRDTFGKHFKVEDGRLVAYGMDGNKLFSAKNPGGDPDFEEAINLLVSGYAYKDQILRGTDKNGTGLPGNSGNRGNQRTLRRSDFNKMNPHEQAAFSALVNKGEAKLIAD